ncbi:MAG: phosphatidylglycerol lysyltransferase domain-containing protein [Raoultibacter sp.]
MNFQPIQLSDKKAIETILRPLRRNDSALGFANLYSLQEKYGTRFCIEDTLLYLRQENRFAGEYAYYLPLGSHNLAQDTTELIRRAREDGGCFRFVGVSSEEKMLLEHATQAKRDIPRRATPEDERTSADFSTCPLTFEEDRDYAEYLYCTETIATYAGSRLAKKRREARKFFQLYGDSASVAAIDIENLDDVLAFQHEWLKHNEHRDSSTHPLDSEHRKIMLDAHHFKNLDLEGIILYVDTHVVGYAYGTLLPGGAFDVLVLKGDLTYHFVWRAVLQELAKHLLGRAEFLNLEEDLGLPGLRESKQNYKPIALLEKFQAFPKI